MCGNCAVPQPPQQAQKRRLLGTPDKGLGSIFHVTAGLRPRLKQISPLRGSDRFAFYPGLARRAQAKAAAARLGDLPDFIRRSTTHRANSKRVVTHTVQARSANSPQIRICSRIERCLKAPPPIPIPRSGNLSRTNPRLQLETRSKFCARPASRPCRGWCMDSVPDGAGSRLVTADEA